MANPITHQCHNCGTSYADRPNKVYCSTACRRQTEHKRAKYDQAVKHLQLRRQRLQEAEQAGNQQYVRQHQAAIKHLENRLAVMGERP